MGDIKNKHKRFARPRKAFDSKRIAEENLLVAKYGLKNKREIWRADFAVKIIRRNAKALITAEENEKNEFIERQQKKGLNVKSIGDVLALSKEAILQRRLQSILVDKKLARSPKHARQLIVHKHVAIDGKKVNIPSYQVLDGEEDKISMILKAKPLKVEKKGEIIKEEGVEKYEN